MKIYATFLPKKIKCFEQALFTLDLFYLFFNLPTLENKHIHRFWQKISC